MQATGFFAQTLTRIAMSRSPAENRVNLANTPLGKLIDDISKKTFAKLTKDSSSAPNPDIERALKELTEHVFTTLATHGIPEPQNLTEEELSDHFITTIIKKIHLEFTSKPAVATKQHFINIANDLLKTAFPNGVNDTKLPLLVRKLLSKQAWGHSIATKIVGQAITWEDLTALFANHLEAIHNSIATAKASQIDETVDPGANEFIDWIISKLEVSTLSFTIDGLSAGSNQFVNSFITRLLRGEIKRAEDAETLQIARTWFIGSLKSSLRAIYLNIFTPAPGQSPEARKEEFAERITTLASKHAPEMAQDLEAIEHYDDHMLRVLQQSWLQDPQKADFHDSLKEAKPDELKALLKRICASVSLKCILQHEMRPHELAKLLPSSLEPEKALGLVYWLLAPYAIEVVAQFADIEKKGETAQRKLQGVNPLIELLLDKGRSLLESKARKGTLKLTNYPVFNRMLCHILTPTNVPSSFEAKKYIDKQIRNIMSVIVAAAIKDDAQEPEIAVADLASGILKEGQEKIVELLKRNTNDVAFEKQFMLDASKSILGKVISIELFESILPPFLRKADLWNELATILADHFEDLYHQAKAIGDLGKRSELSVQAPELRTLITSLEGFILKHLQTPPEKVKEASSQTTPEEALKKSKEKVKAQLMHGEGFINLVKHLLPTLLESLVAYHMNPENGTSSEERAANLFIRLAKLADAGFDKVASYEKAENKPGWLHDAGYTEEKLEAFRQKYEKRLDVKEMILREVADSAVLTLLPKELFEKLIPADFSLFNLQELLAGFAYSYISEAFDYSHAMQQFVATDNTTNEKLVLGLQTYLSKQIERYLAVSQTQEKSWIENVLRLVFSPKNKAILHKITPHIYFRAMGFLFSNAGAQNDKVPNNLLNLFAPIAKEAQELFLRLNSQKADAATRNAAYKAAARKAIDRLFTDEQWKEFIPEFLQSIFSKETAADFLHVAYEMVHTTQLLLQEEEAKGLKIVRKEAGLEAFLKGYFIDNIIELLQTLGKQPEPLNKTLPTLVDDFLKQCCQDETSDVAQIRNTLIERLVNTCAGKIMLDSKTVLEQAKPLLKSYKTGDTRQTAELLIEILLPKELLATPLAKLIVSDTVKDEVGGLVAEIQESQAKFLNSGKEAKAYLDSLEGMPPFLTDIIKSLEDTIEDYTKPGAPKIVDNFPDYINKLLKDAFGDAEFGPIIKTAAKNMVYIIFQDALTPSADQKVEDKILDVAASLLHSYNPKDMKATSAAWLKVLVPENRLKGLLPPFLQKTVTYEKLVKWFFEPYVKQIEAEIKKVGQQLEKPDDYNASRLNDWLTKFLLDHTIPTATKRGLFGQEGVVREMERSILSTLDPEKDKELSGPISAYLKASVSKVTESLEAGGILEARFLSGALAFSLDGPLEAPHDFCLRAKEALLAKAFPKGKESLIVPDVAKDLVWKKVSEAVDKLLSDLQDPKRRILRLCSLLIPFTSDNDALVGQRQQVIEDMKLDLENGKVDPHFDKKTEAMFKRYLVDAAVRQADRNIQETNLWAPIKWIARLVVKAITYLIARLSLRNRIYNFIKDKSNNKKVNNFIWSFLNYKLPAQGQPDLKGKVKTTLSNQKLAPWILQGFLARKFSDFVENKNLVDIISS